MTPFDRFQDLQDRFHELEAFAPEAREQALQALATDDPELHRELLRLMASSDTLAR